MRTSLSLFSACLVAASSANAQETAESVQTNGSAQLTRASEAMISPGSATIPIQLPTTVRKGEILAIEYGEPGKTIADSFMVTGITVRGDTCTIENKRNIAAGTALTDTIHARPCRKLK